ncbi:MAG: YfhO family protein [Chitinophagaceae bacterium]|nr:YfhO family protein [Chitinophagaceae bacterium]
MGGKSILPDLTAVFSLGLPQPVNMFFLSALCFYVLCMAWGTRPVVGIFGGLCYAFATYNPIIIAAGHVTKMFAIAYMPLALAGLILVYTKRYWLGLAVTTLGAYLLLNANHPQISYYFIMVAFFVTIGFKIQWIRDRDFKHLGIAFGTVAVAVVAAALTTALSLMTTSEYSKYTMRGGKSVDIQGDSVKVVQTKGLDTAYAFSYSLGPGEALTALMPGAFGGNSQQLFEDNENIVDALTKRGLPSNVAMQVANGMPKFWGDPNSSGGGPFYSGVIVCLLALLGFVLYKHPLRWALLIVSLLSIIMAMGKYMPSFNTFLFENLPLYNKFRAPSITMVVPQLLLPFVAIIAANLLFFRNEAATLLKADFKKILYALGGLILFLALAYIVMDYGSPMDPLIASSLQRQGANEDIIRALISAMKSERQSIFGGQILRTLLFAGVVAGVIWLFIRNTLKPVLAMAILAVIAVADLLLVGKNYLGEEKYVPAEQMEMQLTRKTQVDQQILADKELHFRVYNAGQEKFSASDYHYPTFHRTVGGYHPAKLRIYQDILERYLYGGTDPTQILNMLNTKYIVVQNPQNGQAGIIPNQDAYGPAWLVQHVEVVPDGATELQSIGSTNLRDTAVIQQSFATGITQPQFDSTASIRLTHFDNDTLVYQFESASPQFAVFSDVYYPAGWNAYIDGNKVEYIRANYVLRGLSIPAGNHEVKFIFEPAVVKKGMTISYIGSWLVLLFVLGGAFMHWRSKQKAKA